MRICIQNTKLNEEGGHDFVWLELPMDEDELDKAIMELIGWNHALDEDTDGYFTIVDSEAEVEMDIDENTDPFELNRLAEKYEELQSQHDYHGHEIVNALIEESPYRSFKDTLEAIEKGDWGAVPGICDEEDLGYHAVDNDWLGEVPDSLRSPLNYEAIGRDLSRDYSINETYGIAVWWP